MKLEIEIADETARTILIENLKWHYGCSDLTGLHLKEDREYNKRLRKAIKVVLRAWMTPDEYAEWKKAVRGD